MSERLCPKGYDCDMLHTCNAQLSRPYTLRRISEDHWINVFWTLQWISAATFVTLLQEDAAELHVETTDWLNHHVTVRPPRTDQIGASICDTFWTPKQPAKYTKNQSKSIQNRCPFWLYLFKRFSHQQCQNLKNLQKLKKTNGKAYRSMWLTESRLDATINSSVCAVSLRELRVFSSIIRAARHLVCSKWPRL